MKRMDHSTRREFKMPRLFYDDIEKIFAILNAAKPGSVTISDGEYEYQNPDEITVDNRVVNTFEIRTYDPYISLTLSNHDAHIYVGSTEEPVGLGLATQIGDIVEARERRFRYNIFRFSSYFLGLFVINVIYHASPVSGMSFSETYFVPEITGVALILLYTYFFLQYRLHSYSTVVFAHSSKQKSFWHRNSDQLIVSAFTAVFSVLATLLVQHLLN